MGMWPLFRSVMAVPVRQILYDVQCGFCTRTARRFRDRLERRGWTFTPIQTPWVRAHLGFSSDQTPAEMALITGDGRTLHGLEAVLELSGELHGYRFIGLLGRIAPLRSLLRMAYRFVASHRFR